MAKKPVENGCVAKCVKVDDKRECSVMVPIWGTGNCRPRTKDEFDPDSFFSKKSGKATIIIGCLKGQYDHEAKRCRKGTRALKTIL